MNINKVNTMIYGGIHMKVKAISIDAYAEASYSGAEYFERLMMTVDDFLKYFCTDEEINTDEKLIEKVHEKFDNINITISELDGKFSEVEADITVDTWTEDDLIECYEVNEGYKNEIINALAGMLEYDYSERNALDEELGNNMRTLLGTLDIKETVTLKVPRSKVAELRAFADKLNNKEE